MKRIFLSTLFSLIYVLISANPFIRIKDLQELDNTTIFSIEQDAKGDMIIYARWETYSYNGYSLRLLEVTDTQRDRKLKDYTDKAGNTYKATGHGLVMMRPDGTSEEIPLGGKRGLPITCVTADRDGNLWVGSYYNGLFFRNGNCSCIDFADIPQSMHNIRSLLTDADGNVWAFTDNSGAYCHNTSDGRWEKLPDSEGLKFQNACTDPQGDHIWAFETEHGLISIDCRKRLLKTRPIKGVEYTYAMMCYGESMLLGGSGGLFIYSPADGSVRKIKGVEGAVYDLIMDRNGLVWIAGGGIYTFDGGRAERQDDSHVLAGSICHDLDFDAEGALWVAVTGHGIARFRDGRTEFHDKASCGMLSDFTNTITCLPGGEIAIGSRGGLSVFNPTERTVFNYGEYVGVDGNTLSGRSSLLMKDGSVWLGTGTGIVVYSPDRDKGGGIVHSAEVDWAVADGCEQPSDTEWLTMEYSQNNMSVYISDHDFDKIRPCRYEYIGPGRKAGGTPFDISKPLSFNRTSVGRNDIIIRKTDLNTSHTEDTPVRVHIKPAWYACTAAKITYVLLALSLASFILLSSWSRIRLKEKLEMSEKQKQKSINFYVDLSYKIRTPVNVAVNVLEKFFKDYGSRTAGIEQLEVVYNATSQIRQSLLAHIDSQEVLLEGSESMNETIRRNSHFVNAVTGAIERHLFTDDRIDVGLLCRELNMGKTRLTEELKEVSGLTPRQFIEDVKLRHALKMLEDGGLRVGEISSMLQFSSPGYFSEKFKSKYGYPPVHFQKRGSDGGTEKA